MNIGTKALLNKLKKNKKIESNMTINGWYSDNLELKCISIPERKSLGAYLWFKKYAADIKIFLDAISGVGIICLSNGSIIIKDDIKVDDKEWNDITVNFIKDNGYLVYEDLDLFRNAFKDIISMSGINM